MSEPTSSTSKLAAAAVSCLPWLAAVHCTHQSATLDGGSDLQVMVASPARSLASRVVAGHVLTSSTSVPVEEGSATYFSSWLRYFVTKGSAASTTTKRRAA